MLDLDFGALRDPRRETPGDGGDAATRAERRRQRGDDAAPSGRVEILTVCTGNICRSPVAALLLDASLPGIAVTSAGTHALAGDTMPDDAVWLAEELGASPDAAVAHRARYLDERVLTTPTLVLAMTRAHRRAVVELAPALLARTFTLREFARLSTDLTADAIRDAAGEGDDAARAAHAVAAVAARRREALPLTAPEDDDVLDPHRRGREAFVASGAQIAPAVAEVLRILHAAGLGR